MRTISNTYCPLISMVYNVIVQSDVFIRKEYKQKAAFVLWLELLNV